MLLNSVNRTILNMFRNYGGDANIIVEGVGGVYDPDTSTYTTTGDSQYSVRVLLMDYTNKKDGLGQIRDTLVQEGDRRCLVLPPQNDYIHGIVNIDGSIPSLLTSESLEPYATENSNIYILEQFLGNIQQPPIQPNKDKIQIGNLVYKIISLKDLDTSGVYSYMYELYIRGA